MSSDEESAAEDGRASVPRSPSGSEAAGAWIDRYRLVEEIGEGGMGTVWLAEQSEPVTRKVALKVIKLGMDTRDVVRRFEAERQALALMDHPGIAKVLDGGATGSGRPFFVMELVDGEPITDHCDAARLDLRQRLELFRQVCEAVQHAHQKGIIHRDLKPSNVLVTERDGVRRPVVIDFGIAKATGPELAQRTMFTQLGQIVGTPETMAPEQAEGDGTDIDTRADVYSLGVLLYELLTGTKTFDVRTALESGYDELLRTIREVEPARPSTRVSSLGRSASSIAATRRVEPATLTRHLRGDLDWIVMKALEKDRERRYETASEFALDVERYLRNEPVLAVPPSALYRFKKLVRRRKKTVAALSVIAFLFAAGAVGTGMGYRNTVRANRALDAALVEKGEALEAAIDQRALADANAERAAAAEARARARAEELEQVASFQSEQLRGIDPALMGTRLRSALLDAVGPTLRDRLSTLVASVNFTNLALGSLEQNLFDRTIEAIDAQFEDQPLVRASLLQSVADTLFDLGLYEQAADPQERALAIRRAELGDDDDRTLDSIAGTGVLLRDRGMLDEAEPLIREAYERSLRLHGEDDVRTLTYLGDVASLRRIRGELAEAEELMRAACEGLRRTLGNEHEKTLGLINNLGALLWDRGSLAEAEPYFREALAGHRRLFGDDHAATLNSLNAMGVLLYAQGRLAEAEPYYREAVAGRRRLLGDEHPVTFETVGNLGVTLRAAGRLSEAEPYYREAFETSRRVLGAEHPTTLIFMRNLGGLLEVQGKLAEAEPYYLEALELSRRLHGDQHRDTLLALGSIGSLRYAQGRLEEAEPYMRECLDGTRSMLGEEHPHTLLESYNLGVLLRQLGQLEEAQRLLHASFEGRRRVLGEDHAYTRNACDSLRTVYEMLVQSARDDGDDLRLGPALAQLGAHELDAGRPQAAEKLLSEALEITSRTLPETDPRIAEVLADLGASLAAQGRHAEAEPVVRESAERALAWPASPRVDPREPPGSADELVQRAIDFYEAWHALDPGAGHDASAASWRERLKGG